MKMEEDPQNTEKRYMEVFEFLKTVFRMLLHKEPRLKQ